MFISDRNYGYAAARAYTAYQDPDFLDLAVTSWTTARRYTISKEQAASRTMDVKVFNLSLSCQGIDSNSGQRHLLVTSLASRFFSPSLSVFHGQLFEQTASSLCELRGFVGGAWLTAISLSALLAEATSNETYLDAAIESANIIQVHLLDPSNIVLDSLSSMLNESYSVDSTVYSYNSGIFIEGLVVLADIAHNTSTEALLHSTIVAIATDTLWQGLDGIIATTTVGGRYIVRAPAALYERNTTTSDLREYIKDYIGVQRATSNGSSIYGLPWTGPPSTLFSSDNHTGALSALLSAIQLVDDQSSSTSNTDPTSSVILTPTALVSSAKKSLTGAIVGGVVGGLAVLGVVIVGIFLTHIRYRRRNNETYFCWGPR
ncbi:hypothetical protein EDD85DRAFT_1008527 [Armillaria nabsnona]|nr:hypothetical protein EDD85DRAFT_1008527 [Armillaria nabsnona]